MIADLKFALCQLRKATAIEYRAAVFAIGALPPPFTLLAMIMLAIGIGLNTAISSGNADQSHHCAPL